MNKIGREWLMIFLSLVMLSVSLVAIFISHNAYNESKTTSQLTGKAIELMEIQLNYTGKELKPEVILKKEINCLPITPYASTYPYLQLVNKGSLPTEYSLHIEGENISCRGFNSLEELDRFKERFEDQLYSFYRGEYTISQKSICNIDGFIGSR